MSCDCPNGIEAGAVTVRDAVDAVDAEAPAFEDPVPVELPAAKAGTVPRRDAIANAEAIILVLFIGEKLGK